MNEKFIKDIIQDFLNKNQKTTLFKERSIIELWDQVAGEYITKNTKKVEIKNGILYVNVLNASLRFELMNMRSVLIQKLNREAGAEVVKDIIFR